MNPWENELADDHTTWELGQTSWGASLVLVYPADSSSATGLNMGSALGCSSWIRDQEMIADMEPLKIQAVDSVHEVNYDVE